MLETLRDSASQWPKAREALRPALPDTLSQKPNLLSEEWTPYYFGLARVAAEMQAVRNLLEPDKADGVVAAILAVLRISGDDANASADFVRAVDLAWNESLRRGENPLPVVANCLYDVLELDEVIEVGAQRIINPVVTLFLQGVLVEQMRAGWWKSFLARNRIA